MKNFLTNIKLQGTILLIIFSISASLFILTTNEMIILWSGILFGGCIYYGLFNNKDKSKIIKLQNKCDDYIVEREQYIDIINDLQDRYNSISKLATDCHNLNKDLLLELQERTNKYNNIVDNLTNIICERVNITKTKIKDPEDGC